MGRCEKIYEKAQASVSNLRFAEACKLAECFRFQYARQTASHVIFKYPGWIGTLTLQDVNGKAKGYQVRQLLNAVEELGLTLTDEGE